MNKLISHITDTMVIIREIYADYGEKVLTPQIDINGGISSATFRKFITDHTANMMNFFKMNLFWAALTPELQGVIAQKDQEDMTIKKMYRTRKPAAINEVSTEDVDNEQDETDVAAFQDCQNTQGARPKNTGASFQNNTNKNFQNQSRGGQQNYSNSRRSGLGNNANRNRKFNTIANGRTTGKKSVNEGFVRTSLAEMRKEDHSGRCHDPPPPQ